MNNVLTSYIFFVVLYNIFIFFKNFYDVTEENFTLSRTGSFEDFSNITFKLCVVCNLGCKKSKTSISFNIMNNAILSGFLLYHAHFSLVMISVIWLLWGFSIDFFYYKPNYRLKCFKHKICFTSIYNTHVTSTTVCNND